MCGGSGQCLTILRLSFISRMRASDLKVKLDAEHETVWLTQTQIAELFGIKRPAITKHLGNIFSSGELDRDSVSSILEHTAMDGKVYKTQFYNLDAIILVGYRVNRSVARLPSERIFSQPSPCGLAGEHGQTYDAYRRYPSQTATAA